MAEKNSAQTNRQQTDTTKIMVTWPWTNFGWKQQGHSLGCGCNCG